MFQTAVLNRRLKLTSADLRLAAELWAQSRQRGRPTADPHALDVDVILAAQAIYADNGESNIVVPTSNAKHLNQFVDSRDWQTI